MSAAAAAAETGGSPSRSKFQLADGLDRLLDSYRAHGGHDVTAEHIRIYELCLIAGWYRAALSDDAPHSPAHELGRMRSLLRQLR